MSDEESNYHGYRYLVDANTKLQYAVQFNNGAPSPDIQTYSGDNGNKTLLPANKTVFALDDRQEVENRGSEGIFVKATAFQIPVGSDSKPTGILYTPVEYKVTPFADKANPGKIKLKYELTASSLTELLNDGFDKDSITASFENSTNAKTAGNKAAFNLSGLRVPPAHDKGAHAARAALETPNTLASNSNNNPSRPDSTPPSRPRNSFNNTTSSADKANYRVKDNHIEAIIKEYCKDLTAEAEAHRLDPVIGRDTETDQALKVLTRRKQSSLCFTGSAGVGKTAMFSAVAQRLVDDKNLPNSLASSRVIQLDLQAMNAGAKYRGQFEERLKPLIDGLQERGGILNGRKVIIAIDEIHSQLTAGKAEGGSDSGNMMKPFLTAPGISVMGTTTDEEYKKHIEKDNALASRFEKTRLNAPDEENTVKIIKKLWPLTKEHHGFTHDLSDEDIHYIVSMTNAHAPQESQPRKAEKVMNMAAASADFSGSDGIRKEDILAAVAQMSGLSSDFLDKNDSDRFLKLEKELPNKVLGQPGIQRIADGLIGARSGLTDENQPWGCFVLQGPTGTGKTETCKVIAEQLFGDRDAIIQLNMAEYSEKHTVSRLIGAPPGFVGFDSAEPALTEQIRRKPNSILLLDEIEKAHPDVFNTLLPILNDGKMKDNHGNTVLFNNVIVVMTSNAGAQEATNYLQGNDMGFGGGHSERTDTETDKRLGEIYSRAMQKHNGGPFAPEMINRINALGGFITFRPLSEVVIEKLVDNEIKKINERLVSRKGAHLKGAQLVLTHEVKAELAEKGYDPAMGARPLQGLVRAKVQGQLAKWLIHNREKVDAFVTKNGQVELVVDSLDSFEPKLKKVAPVNDNKAESKKVKVKKPS